MNRHVIAALLLFSVGQIATSVANAVEIGKAFEISADYQVGDRFMGATLLGALQLTRDEVNGISARELSAISWDEDEQLLYALSDDATLLHLKLAFDGNQLTGVDLVAAFFLKDSSGAALSKALADSEGLAIRGSDNGVSGDTELIVSFEGAPRITSYTPTGTFIKQHPLPPTLADVSAYTETNEVLEALTLHPKLGLLTAPQRPLKSADANFLQVYDLAGHEWTLPPIDHRHSALVSLETMPNGDLLALERRYISFFRPVIFALRRLSFEPTMELDSDRFTVEDIVKFDSSMGWRIDNFEGIARHNGERYFMVSDDNKNVIQKTLLLYLDLAREDQDSTSPAALSLLKPRDQLH